MIKNIIHIFFLFFVLRVSAQQHEILNERIRTLQVLPNGAWNKLAVISLGTSDYLDISFDDLTHEYHRYRYKVKQCNFDWLENEQLFESDYLKGETSDQPIEQFEKSINTSVLYTHYNFRFPNNRVGVSLSGNYRLTIFDDDEDEEVAHVYFMVIDEKVNILASVSSDTDIDHDRSHQQLKFSVNPSLLRLSNPQVELHTVVLQNNRWDNAAINPKPDFVTPTDIQWKYSEDLIFLAGNEYRKFESTNLHYGTMGIDKIRWIDSYYHAILYEGKARPNYVYDEDKDGAFYIRSEEYDDYNTQCDYMLVHFILRHDFIPNGSLYVGGNFVNGRYLPECRMEYQAQNKTYEAIVLLKQGYYNYQYFFVPNGKEVGLNQPVEGDYYQTENKYSILIYYRPIGGRRDQLVGIREMSFISSK